ncbi:MAG: hypothetical protein DGJ47_000848 [Rickettsiaceae bacterium]
MIKLNYPKFWQTNSWLSLLLTPASWIYLLFGKIRLWVTKPIKIPAFVICVGNITVGGSGKTQIVKWLCQNLQPKYNILVVTKGYGSNLKQAKIVSAQDLASNVGDEAKLLSSYSNVIAARSPQEALPLIKEAKPEIVIFDDGLQNPGFIKDMNILAINTERGFGNQKIFPAGPLRQTHHSVDARIDCNILIGNKPLNTLINTKSPCFNAQIEAENYKSTKNYLAFSGIANPNSFFDLLNSLSFKVKHTISFPDHYNYGPKDIKTLLNNAKQKSLHLITTEKDYVKLQNMVNIEYLPVNLKIDNDKELIKFIYEKITISN